MTNTRIRSLVLFVIIVLLLLVIAGIVYFFRRGQQEVTDHDVCLLPKQFSTEYDFDYSKKAHEYRNTDSPIDYFRLSLSWSPTFCSENKNLKHLFQCQNSFGFIVHGLWPSTSKKNSKSPTLISHPRNCRNEKPMALDIIKKYFCIIPSEILMQSEWEKHGTCYWQKPEEYFEKIAELYSKINIPKNMKDILNQEHSSVIEAVRKGFLGVNPELTPDKIDVVKSPKQQTVSEVAFCYDRSFNYITCKRNM